MMYKVFILSLTLILAACQPPQITTVPAPAADVNEQNAPTRDAELQKQIAEIALGAKGKVGVCAVLLEIGESVGLNENERFAMQSVVKVPISMAVLHKVDLGELRLDQMVRVERTDMTTTNQRSPIRDTNPNGAQMTVEELIKAAIVESDGTASDVLQRLVGGAAGVQEFIELIDISDMEIKYSHKEFGSRWELQYENWSTPKAAYELLYMLWLASPNEARSTRHTVESYKLLEKFMTESNNPDDRILGMLPEGTTVAHKTGTGGTRDGITSVTADVGIITLPNGNHVAIAVFVGDSSGTAKERADVIAKIARAAFDKWSGAKTDAPADRIGFNERHTLN